MDRPMEGMRCVVTGATAGIGYETARILAERGGSVIGIGRDRERCAKAEARIAEETGNRNARFEAVDLSSQTAIRTFTSKLLRESAPIDVLVNNAGIFSSRYRESPEGIELQFAVNYLAGFLLTRLLIPLLRAAPRARVIGLSSGSHFAGSMHWKDLGLRRGYFGLKAYEQSKLAVILFLNELSRRLGEGSTISTVAVDPGLVRTEIGAKDAGFITRMVWRFRTRKGISPRESAESIVDLASDPGVEGKTGLYWKAREPLPSSTASKSIEDAHRLWKLSEELCGGNLPPV